MKIDTRPDGRSSGAARDMGRTRDERAGGVAPVQGATQGAGCGRRAVR